jgi:hypothetical protein
MTSFAAYTDEGVFAVADSREGALAKARANAKDPTAKFQVDQLTADLDAFYRGMNNLHFMEHPGLGQPRVFVFRSEKDRNDRVRSLSLSGHSGHRAISRDEAFALVHPDASGKRRFNVEGAVGDYMDLPSDWQPGCDWVLAQGPFA